jgi:hypothetical protein
MVGIALRKFLATPGPATLRLRGEAHEVMHPSDARTTPRSRPQHTKLVRTQFAPLRLARPTRQRLIVLIRETPHNRARISIDEYRVHGVLEFDNELIILHHVARAVTFSN